MASEIADTVAAIADATDWSQRVQLIRRVPDAHGAAAHRQVYADPAHGLGGACG